MAASILKEIYCDPEEIEWVDLEQAETINGFSINSPEETPQPETDAAAGTPEQPRQQVARISPNAPEAAPPAPHAADAAETAVLSGTTPLMEEQPGSPEPELWSAQKTRFLTSTYKEWNTLVGKKEERRYHHYHHHYRERNDGSSSSESSPEEGDDDQFLPRNVEAAAAANYCQQQQQQRQHHYYQAAAGGRRSREETHWSVLASGRFRHVRAEEQYRGNGQFDRFARCSSPHTRHHRVDEDNDGTIGRPPPSSRSAAA
ncbi:hypothetical protein HPB50_008436 [Hyalomma asiaticum]|uniref:Uncharacterized protein n=1 Tax=Hyalomma asiaticum TaxID=266040 RepID=A0ACB7T8M8_HYAAI|nr:hypothetical protein HPB50_008436 [Hyalomma asiaticum]